MLIFCYEGKAHIDHPKNANLSVKRELKMSNAMKN